MGIDAKSFFTALVYYGTINSDQASSQKLHKPVYAYKMDLANDEGMQAMVTDGRNLKRYW